MPRVFARIGQTDVSVQAQRFISFIQRRRAVPYTEAYRFLHAAFPSAKDLADLIQGCVNAGFVRIENRSGIMWVIASDQKLPATVIKLEPKQQAG